MMTSNSTAAGRRRARRGAAFAVSLAAFLAVPVTGQGPGDPGLFCRVVDVGAGLCCVVRMPNNDWVIYDGGSFKDNGYTATKAIMELIPARRTVTQLIVSHSDSDHLYAVPSIMQLYRVKQVLRSGFERTSAGWRMADATIDERAQGSTVDLNLAEIPGGQFVPGTSVTFGSNATLTIVQGFHEPPASWGALDSSKFRNAGSIVVRIEYQGRSILLMGDAVGRLENGDADDVIQASEAQIVDNIASVPIDSDVLIASHHGADNGTSGPFIDAVTPEWVIFSAGHAHEHPRASTVDRSLARNFPVDHILRTDLGDNEGDAEWSVGATTEGDREGDDDIDIHISPAGVLTVRYRNGR